MCVRLRMLYACIENVVYSFPDRTLLSKIKFDTKKEMIMSLR